VPHDDIQEYLYGRYYLSPSRLYSVIRLLPDKQGYDVPVAGDWVTIAVVAERGPIKLSRAPVGLGPGDGGDEPEHRGSGEASGKGSNQRGKKDASTSGGGRKKYVNFKLIDFGARSKSSSSATGGKSVIRGDAFLSLLLFESDCYDLETREDGGKTVKVYRGGSKGAFETMSKLKEGDVIALLNPRILKPFQVRLSMVLHQSESDRMFSRYLVLIAL
jgi:minichromosome maintenance protein 10